MFHNFAIHSNGENLRLINNDLASVGLRNFLCSIEYNNKDLLTNNFNSATINKGLFLLNDSYYEESINIGIASSSNDSLLMYVFAGLIKRYNINVEYSFYCNKLMKAGNASSINNIYSFKDYSRYDDICNDVNSSLLDAKIVSLLNLKNIDLNRLSIKKIDSNTNVSFGMEYIENKYSLIFGNDVVYYNLSLDRVTNTEKVPKNRLININGKNYMICGINWSKTSDFKIEGILQDMDQKIVIKNMFNIIDLKKAC
jgi:hypothetical protein